MGQVTTEVPAALLPAVARVLKFRIEKGDLELEKIKRLELVMELTAGGQTIVFAFDLGAEHFERGSGIIVPGGLAGLPTPDGQG